MFDRSPIGLNHWLACASAACWPGISSSTSAPDEDLPRRRPHYGYNLSIGDGQHPPARLAQRPRGITIGNNAVIGSYSRIFSHSHNAESYGKVTLIPTVIAPARASPATPLCWRSTRRDGASVGNFLKTGSEAPHAC